MKIFLCYGYRPYTTALYFERALQQEHEVYYIGPAYWPRTGYTSNEDLFRLIENGLPQPDLVLFIEPGQRFFPRGLEKMVCPTAVYLVDVHQDLNHRLAQAPFFDYIFVAQQDYVSVFAQMGYQQVYWLPLACDPIVHGHKQETKKWDIGFVGHPNSVTRTRRLELLSKHFTMNDYHCFYPKEKISEIYSQSKIVFNSAVNGDLNMRVFEGMASGSLLVTDQIKNGQEVLFKNGIHLVEYKDDSSLLKAVEYYLAHDEEREQIASAGAQLVMSEHTYWHRCQFIIKTIFDAGSPHLDAKLELAWRQRRGYTKVLGIAFISVLRVLYHIARQPHLS
ncbi:MAG: glycosyltransferase [Chloroflexi bacterium]|nr:glycosyltransferase [Chloroflexota bacterium]